MKKIKRIILILLGAIILASNSLPVFALKDSLKGMYHQNKIYFYQPERCISASVGSYSGGGGGGMTGSQAEFIEKYHDIAEKLSIAYGIPWETVMAQGILESASGTSNYAVQRNNFFGIGAFDSNPDNAFSYATPEEGWEGYYKNIVITATYRNHGVFQGDTITDPYAYAQAIKDAGYATDPDYVSKLSSLVGSIEAISKEHGWLSSAELAEKYPEMLENAANNAAGGGGGGSAGGGSSAMDLCDDSEGGNGDINKTAIDLSWPTPGHNKHDAKPEYEKALAETGTGAQSGDNCARYGASCDMFVATVLRYSGVDQNVPIGDTTVQYNYYMSHPNLYKQISGASTESIRPGDIMIRPNESATVLNGHTRIIVQDTDGQYKFASASHCNRTAERGAEGFSLDSSYTIFRYIGGNSKGDN